MRGRPLAPELRSRDEVGQIKVAPLNSEPSASSDNGRKQAQQLQEASATPPTRQTSRAPGKRIVLPYGIARNRLADSAKRLKLRLKMVDTLDEAEALVTLKNIYRRRPRVVADAERQGTPIYVLRANTTTQIEDFLVDLYDLETDLRDPFEEAMLEAQAAIEHVRNGENQIDLSPQSSDVRRHQHELAREANLVSHSYGRESQRHVRIYRE